MATSNPTQRNASSLSLHTLLLLNKLKAPASPHQNPDQDDEIKVFYCSRTHSQLTQFAHELRRVALPPSIPEEVESEFLASITGQGKGLEERIKHVVLGSRKTLCINPKVQSTGNPTAINERCLDLQRPGADAKEKCPFLPTKDNEALLSEFQDHTLAKVRDIEDIGALGKSIGICPYYATRSVIKDSEVSDFRYLAGFPNLPLKDHHFTLRTSPSKISSRSTSHLTKR